MLKFYQIIKQRIKINLKYIKTIIGNLSTAEIAILGFLNIFFPLSDLIDGYIGKTDYLLLIKVGYFLGGLLLLVLINFIIAAIYTFNKNEVELFYIGNNHKVFVGYGDIFNLQELESKNKLINVVIPVNRCFDTLVDDDLVSKNTLHGKLMSQLYEKGVYTQEELNKTIKSQLKGKDITETLEKCNKRKGNLIRYEAGTVVEISNKDKIKYYLLGLSSFDKNLHAQTSKEEYCLALIRLLNYIEIHSQGYPVVIPIIAGGAANLKSNEQDLLEYMIKLVKLNLNAFKSDIYILIRNNAKNKIVINDL